MSKISHCRIFRLKILHRQFHLILTVLVRKNTKKEWKWRNLHRWQKFYTAAGMDKFHLWLWWFEERKQVFSDDANLIIWGKEVCSADLMIWRKKRSNLWWCQQWQVIAAEGEQKASRALREARYFISQQQHIFQQISQHHYLFHHVFRHIHLSYHPCLNVTNFCTFQRHSSCIQFDLGYFYSHISTICISL